MDLQALEARLETLEIKQSFAEDLVDSLNRTIYRQQQQMDQLLLELQSLRDEKLSDPGQTQFRSLRDDIPPHY
jgi:SlyX protein